MPMTIKKLESLARRGERRVALLKAIDALIKRNGCATRREILKELQDPNIGVDHLLKTLAQQGIITLTRGESRSVPVKITWTPKPKGRPINCRCDVVNIKDHRMTRAVAKSMGMVR